MSNTEKLVLTIIFFIVGLALISTGFLAPMAYLCGIYIRQIWAGKWD